MKVVSKTHGLSGYSAARRAPIVCNQRTQHGSSMPPTLKRGRAHEELPVAAPRRRAAETPTASAAASASSSSSSSVAAAWLRWMEAAKAWEAWHGLDRRQGDDEESRWLSGPMFPNEQEKKSGPRIPHLGTTAKYLMTLRKDDENQKSRAPGGPEGQPERAPGPTAPAPRRSACGTVPETGEESVHKANESESD